MIDLTLARVSRLLDYTPQTWKAIHVAGTNGKGSICAYLSAMLHACGQSCGRFTSPHLIDRWDCVTIDEKPVSEKVFRDAEETVKQRDLEDKVGATEFELLTATAFEIFHRSNVRYGVIEVGLGGRLDATNAMKKKAVTIISKIGLDHQSFLGNTVEEIAVQKAGIMRCGVPCVVDVTNQPAVLDVLRAHARDVGTELQFPTLTSYSDGSLPGELEPHQSQNLACAHSAFRLAYPEGPSLGSLLPAVRNLQWPGRLQSLDISKVTGRKEPVLLDGAHNVQSAEVLASFVKKRVRGADQHVTWVLAASQGKDMRGIINLLLQPGDRVVAVRFGPVDGMPWVQAANTTELLSMAGQHNIAPADQYDAKDDVHDALVRATEQAGDEPIVIAGSLYLVSSVLRLLRDADAAHSTF